MNVTGKNTKIIGANLDINMVDDVLQFHNKGNLMMDMLFYHRIAPHTLSAEQFHSLERSDYEITPFHDQSIQGANENSCSVRRNRSALKFTDHAIPFSKLLSLCANSFRANADGSRPYPSGGALYPVEVICAIFSKQMYSTPISGFYHYRPTLNSLQLLKTADDDVMRDILFRMELPGTKYPNFALLYMGVVSKALVKYHYRGYRYMLMEAGAMFQQADLVAKSLGLCNKIYSGFNDHEILQYIGLDKINFMPFAIQSFGVRHENNT